MKDESDSKASAIKLDKLSTESLSEDTSKIFKNN
jgi:hypothetical protein